MHAGRESAPVFVIGAPGAGTRLLALALGQHPRIAFLPRGWLGTLSAALGGVWREAAAGTAGGPAPTGPGGDMDAFLGPFGEAAALALDAAKRRRAPADPGKVEVSADVRWVEGEPGDALLAYGLSRLFPRGRFIHLLRAPEPAVRSLAGSSVPGASYFTEASALEAWVRHVRASLLAERALGPEAVLRVSHGALVDRPETEVGHCLAFLDEPFHAACLRPLRGIDADPPDGGLEGAVADLSGLTSWPEARDLWHRLLSEDAGGERPDGRGSREALEQLARDFLARASEGEAHAGSAAPVERIRAVALAGVPEGGTVLVVSRGDEELVRLPGRTGWHFPQTPDGVYAGHHPGDSAEAVAHLEELRGRGADYLLIPCSAFWWLEHYDELGRYLDARFRVAAFHEDLCILFALRRDGAGGRVRVARSGAEGEGALAAAGEHDVSVPPPR